MGCKACYILLFIFYNNLQLEERYPSYTIKHCSDDVDDSYYTDIRLAYDETSNSYLYVEHCHTLTVHFIVSIVQQWRIPKTQTQTINFRSRFIPIGVHIRSTEAPREQRTI